MKLLQGGFKQLSIFHLNKQYVKIQNSGASNIINIFCIPLIACPDTYQGYLYSLLSLLIFTSSLFLFLNSGGKPSRSSSRPSVLSLPAIAIIKLPGLLAGKGATEPRSSFFPSDCQ